MFSSLLINMQWSRIEKKCESCGNVFKVIKCRQKSARYCSRKCYDQSQAGRKAWNQGRTWEEMFGEQRAKNLKNHFHDRFKGQNNPMWGRKHSENTKKKMSKKKEGYIPWITGKKFPGIFKHFNRRGENNAYIKYVLKTEGITYEEYQKRLTDKEKYYREVIRITRLQNITLLDNHEKRAKAPQEHAYHLDHIYPVIKGFENRVPPEIIGDISNLRFIPWKENLYKSDKLLEEARKQLYENSVSI